MINAFSFNAPDFRLKLRQQLEVGAGVGAMTLATNRRFLYAMLRGKQPRVATIGIDALTGAPTVAAVIPIVNSMAYLATDRSGRYLLGASYTDAAFAIVPINKDGTVAATPAQVVATPPHAHCIVPDANNRFLLVTSLGGEKILTYAFSAATGQVAPNEPPFVATPTGSGPRHLVFHPTADIVYANTELDAGIGVYRFNPLSGRLERIQNVKIISDGVAAAPWAADLQITADGRYVYASERRTDTLAIFAVDSASGKLEHRGNVTTEAQPRSFAISPDDRFLFLAGEHSNHLAMYAIDPSSGELALRERYPVGEKPGWVTVAALP